MLLHPGPAARSDLVLYCYFYVMKYFDKLRNRVYNSETGTLLKCCMDVEELGDGWTRNTLRKVMLKNEEDGYFVYVYKVTVDRRCRVQDVQEYIVPVKEDWVREFVRSTPDVWPPN